MYRSYLLIDTGNNPDRPRPGRLWLRNRYHVHQRLSMAFPSMSRKTEDPEFLEPFRPHEFGNGQVHVKRTTGSGFLFVVEPLRNGRAMIIVQSAIKPDWGYAFRNAEHLLAAAPEIKPFDPHFCEADRLRFRLMANPTRRLSKHSPDAKEKSIGKRVPIPSNKLVDWLARRAEPSGFSIQPDTITVQEGYIYMKKDGDGQRLRSVLFEGLLEVTDPDAFRQVLVCGIGSGKAFGFGLLSVAPAPISTREIRNESPGPARSS